MNLNFSDFDNFFSKDGDFDNVFSCDSDCFWDSFLKGFDMVKQKVLGVRKAFCYRFHKPVSCPEANPLQTKVSKLSKIICSEGNPEVRKILLSECETLRSRIAEILDAHKLKEYEHFVNKLEQHDQLSRSKLFWDEFRRFGNNASSIENKVIKSFRLKRDSEDFNEYLTFWAEFYEDLYSCPLDQNFSSGNFPGVGPPLFEDSISLGEVISALKVMKVGKAPGHDEIKVEDLKFLLQDGSQSSLSIFHKILNTFWKNETIPSRMKISVIIYLS